MRPLLAIAFVSLAASCSRPDTRAADYPVDQTPPPPGTTYKQPETERVPDGPPTLLVSDAGVPGNDRPDAGAERQRVGPESPPDIVMPRDDAPPVSPERRELPH